MSHSRAVLLMVLVTLMWSIAGVVTRHLQGAESFEVSFWRSAFTMAALSIGLSLMRGALWWGELRHARWPVWVSGLFWAVMFTAFMVAITLTTVANVLITLAVGPLVTALFARLFLRHRLPPTTWLAIAAASLGIAWMFRQEGEMAFSLIGTLVALAVPLAGAVNFTLLQHVGLDRRRVSADAGKTGQDMLPAVLLGASLSALAMLPLSWPFQASSHDLSLLLLLGVFQLAIPCLLVVRLSMELPAPEISLLAQLEVVFGVTWAWLWAGEQLSANTLIGGTLVLGAMVANELARIYRARSTRQRLAGCG
jgi:drug/metabolite transporter (DMT)-like permease